MAGYELRMPIFEAESGFSAEPSARKQSSRAVRSAEPSFGICKVAWASTIGVADINVRRATIMELIFIFHQS